MDARRLRSKELFDYITDRWPLRRMHCVFGGRNRMNEMKKLAATNYYTLKLLNETRLNTVTSVCSFCPYNLPFAIYPVITNVKLIVT